MDFKLIILFAFVEIVMDESTSDELKELRVDALTKVQRSLNHYHHLGYIRKLTNSVAACRLLRFFSYYETSKHLHKFFL